MSYKMPEYDKIDIWEGIDINKTNSSRECHICQYWYFKDIDFNYEPYFFAMVVMVWCKKLWILMMLLFFMLKEMLTEFIFGIWAKMMR